MVPQASSSPVTNVSALDSQSRRWLHDKYERLAAEESTLAANRTSYFAAIGAVLLTALVVALNDFINTPRILILVVSFLAGLGLLVSIVWVILLRRTTDAQNLWRESIRELERTAPPLEGQILIPIVLRSGETMDIDLLRPYTAHSNRFSKDKRVSWLDRLTPESLTQVLPGTFVIIWLCVLVAVVGYYLA
jgi:uncharacterized membrane protein YhaH (DUF805 family)